MEVQEDKPLITDENAYYIENSGGKWIAHYKGLSRVFSDITLAVVWCEGERLKTR